MKTELGRKEYVKLFCEILVREYGSTLAEWHYPQTDLCLSKALFRRMKKHLSVSPSDMTMEEWKTWRRKFLEKHGNFIKVRDCDIAL